MRQLSIAMMLFMISIGFHNCYQSVSEPAESMKPVSPINAVSGIKRTPLQQQDLSLPGKEAIQVRIDFEPGAAFGRHSHPGEEIIYVIEGSLEYEVEGKTTVTLRQGDVLFIPAGKIHSAKNVGSNNAAELATYIVEKGKPLLVLAK